MKLKATVAIATSLALGLIVVARCQRKAERHVGQQVRSATAPRRLTRDPGTMNRLSYLSESRRFIPQQVRHYVPNLHHGRPRPRKAYRFAHAMDKDTMRKELSITAHEKAGDKTLELGRCLEAAAFSFECYSNPEAGDGVWERDGNGNDLAYLSPVFVQDAFQGLLEMKLVSAGGLPLISKPFVTLRLRDSAWRTETTRGLQGISLGRTKRFGLGSSRERLGEQFFMYTADAYGDEEGDGGYVNFEVWSNLFFFNRKLGSARLKLEDVCDGKVHNISLPVSGRLRKRGKLNLQLKFHAWEKVEEENGVPVSIHDVTALGVHGEAIDKPYNLSLMDDGELMTHLRRSGQRISGQKREEMIKFAQNVQEKWKADAERNTYLKLYGRVAGKENAQALAKAVREGEGLIQKGQQIAENGDTEGALEAAARAGLSELGLNENSTLQDIMKGIGKAGASGFGGLGKIGEKAKRAAMARVASGLELMSNEEGSAWQMLQEATSLTDGKREKCEACAFFSNDETDTQGYVYRSKADRVIWISFRGTEDSAPKDFVTDMMIMPQQPEFTQVPVKGSVTLSSIKLEGLDSDATYSLKLEHKAKGKSDTLVENAEHRCVTGWVTQGRFFGARSKKIELNDVRSGDAISVSLWKQKKRVEGQGKGEGDDSDMELVESVPLTADSSGRSWYPLGVQKPVHLRMKVTFSPEPMKPSERAAKEDNDPMQVHSGFLVAYDSIRKRVLALVDEIIGTEEGGELGEDGRPEPWKVYVTGHSLGGALTTLMSYELAVRNERRMREGVRVAGSKTVSVPELIIKSYTFGSPRVGNRKFARKFLEAVQDSWRIYNAKDIIATVPRMVGYSHVQTGVLIESDNNTLRIGAASRQDQDLKGVDEGDTVESIANDVRGKSLSEAFEHVDKNWNKIVAHEMEMLRMLSDGSAIAEHMEDFYFDTLQRIILKRLGVEMPASPTAKGEIDPAKAGVGAKEGSREEGESGDEREKVDDEDAVGRTAAAPA